MVVGSQRLGAGHERLVEMAGQPENESYMYIKQSHIVRSLHNSSQYLVDT